MNLAGLKVHILARRAAWSRGHFTVEGQPYPARVLVDKATYAELLRQIEQEIGSRAVPADPADGFVFMASRILEATPERVRAELNSLVDDLVEWPDSAGLVEQILALLPAIAGEELGEKA